MPRPQFTLRALLMAILVVAAFFGGMAVQRKLDEPISHHPAEGGALEMKTMRDGSTWFRVRE